MASTTHGSTPRMSTPRSTGAADRHIARSRPGAERRPEGLERTCPKTAGSVRHDRSVVRPSARSDTARPKPGKPSAANQRCCLHRAIVANMAGRAPRNGPAQQHQIDWEGHLPAYGRPEPERRPGLPRPLQLFCPRRGSGCVRSGGAAGRQCDTSAILATGFATGSQPDPSERVDTCRHELLP